MEKSSSKTWLVITVVLAIVTSFLVFNYLRGLTTVQSGETVQVVVAAKNIAAGTRVTPDMVKTIIVPEGSQHPHVISSKDQVVNKFVTVDVVAEEALLTDKLTSSEASKELPYKIPEGHRAITIAINAVSGVAGHIQPGYHVDVLISCEDPKQNNGTNSLTLLQNVLVLAVGTDLEKDQEADAGAGNITLAVTPDQAEYVTLAEASADIKLTLRPVDDDQQVPLRKINFDWLLSQY